MNDESLSYAGNRSSKLAEKDGGQNYGDIHQKYENIDRNMHAKERKSTDYHRRSRDWSIEQPDTDHSSDHRKYRWVTFIVLSYL